MYNIICQCDFGDFAATTVVSLILVILPPQRAQLPYRLKHVPTAERPPFQGNAHVPPITVDDRCAWFDVISVVRGSLHHTIF